VLDRDEHPDQGLDGALEAPPARLVPERDPEPGRRGAGAEDEVGEAGGEDGGHGREIRPGRQRRGEPLEQRHPRALPGLGGPLGERVGLDQFPGEDVEGLRPLPQPTGEPGQERRRGGGRVAARVRASRQQLLLAGPEVGAPRVGLEEPGQAAEVAVDEHLVGPRLACHRVHAQAAEAVAGQHPAGGGEEALLGGHPVPAGLPSDLCHHAVTS
jgi:hypothetical protein